MKLWHKLVIFLLPLVLACCALSGCEKNSADTEALDAYRTQEENAFQEISDAYDRLEALDGEEAADTEAFLTAVGDLSDAMEKAASIEAPASFSEAQSLLEEASSDMKEAKDNFSSALSSDSPDEDLLKKAASEYQKAQDTLQSAITLLRDTGSTS